jgi:hypothetical protein
MSDYPPGWTGANIPGWADMQNKQGGLEPDQKGDQMNKPFQSAGTHKIILL